MDSLASSFAQVQLDSSPGSPVTRLPNELVHAFLVKLEMHELIHLRLVCPRWKVVIESIAQTKKSLILSYGTSDAFDFNEMTKRFFGQIDVKHDFVLIKLNSKALSLANACYFGLFLVKLFPNVQHLVIQTIHLYRFYSVFVLWPVQQISTLSLSCDFNAYEEPQVTHFANWINSLTALKRFDLKGDFSFLLRHISPNIFANLEHFSHDLNDKEISYSIIKKVFSQLGPKCTRLSLLGFGHLSTNVSLWLNADLISNLTHLGLPFWLGYYQLWEEMSDKFTSLQTLYIQESFLTKTSFLSSQLLNILSRLPVLTQLQLYGFAIHLHLDEEPESKFIALVNVRSFVLYLDARYHPTSSNNSDRERLTQFLVDNFFPNIQQLTIEEH